MVVRFILIVFVVYFFARTIQRVWLAYDPACSVRNGSRQRAAKRSTPASSTNQRRVDDRSPWDVLGVAPGASIEEIRAAYQRQVMANHPDRVANMAQEFRDLAESRTKEINAAYSQLKRSSV